MAGARSSAYWAAAALLVGALAAIALWNASAYPPFGGYDEAEHQAYAELLIHHGGIPGPEVRGEYYTPPGFYAVAGLALLLGDHVHPSNPVELAHFENVLFLVGTALLVLLLARIVFPGRPLLQLAALGYYCFLPVVFKTGAMFHPETLSVFLTALSLYVGARILARRSFGRLPAVALGVTLGAGQLVRAFSLWTFAAVLLTLGAAWLVRYAPRRRLVAFAGVVVAATALVAGPWYVRQAIKYRNPVFDQPTESRPFYERRPAAFYTSLGLPQVFSSPIRPEFLNEALPTTYSEIWGDYFGAYAWGAPTPPDERTARQLRRQNQLGLAPTAFALAGWLALLALSLRRRWLRKAPERLLVALLPGLGILGYLYFTVSYPTPDGDVLKATYMLTTAPAWALAFGFAVDRVGSLGRWVALGLAAFLLATAVFMLPFLVFHDPTGFL